MTASLGLLVLTARARERPTRSRGDPQRPWTDKMMFLRSVQIAAVLSLLIVLIGCAPSTGSRGPETVMDPPPPAVSDALRFGALAPLPDGSHVVALFHQPSRDPYTELAVRMPTTAVEPFLAASGMGTFEPYTSAPTVTVFDTPTPESAPSTKQTRVLNHRNLYVSRAAAAEPEAPGTTLLHLWLLTT